MMQITKWMATGLGIGYIGKGAGSVAAAATCVLWYLAQANGFSDFSFICITCFTTAVGIWAAFKVENLWGKDHQRVVVDEIAGMCVSLLYVPFSISYMVSGFLLFRFFDIVKPLFIRKLEKLPGGLGVMADDILAGIYANLILQLIIAFKVY